MVEGKAVILNETGMHARVASSFIHFVNRYPCSVNFIKENKKVNAKSILNVLMMGLIKGSEITVVVEGKEEEKVLKEVLEYLKNMKD